MTLTVTVIAVVIFLALIIGVAPTLPELKATREKAGADLIKLRDESHAEGFVDDGTFDERFKKASDAYTSAKEAEEKELAAKKRRDDMHDLGQRIGADAERLSSQHRGNLRPDYDPRQDPRASGRTNVPTASDWGRALQLWASARRPDFAPDEQDMTTLRRCRANANADEFILPSGPTLMRMVAATQGIFRSHNHEHVEQAIQQVWASWNTNTPESAAYIAEPPQVIRQLEINKLAFGGLLQVATIRQTTTGEDILLPFTDDTAVKGRRIAEDGPIGNENNPKFGQIRWGAWKYTSDAIYVTFEMLRDSFVDLESHIGNVGGERLGRAENDDCTIGNGASMPRGIVFAAPVGRTAAANNAITTDEIIDLEASVDDAYSQSPGGRVGYMMNKSILTYLRKLKDLNGQPFYRLGQETGNRDELNGKPIFINYSMAAMGASADVMLFGDYSKYVIRRVGGQRVVRDPYTQLISRDVQIFAVLEYLDGNLVNTGTAPVKKLRMAA